MTLRTIFNWIVDTNIFIVIGVFVGIIAALIFLVMVCAIIAAYIEQR